MNTKRKLILLIVLIILAAVVLILERPFEKGSTTRDDDADMLFPGIDETMVHRLDIIPPDDDSVTFVRQTDGWTVRFNDQEYPADSKLVDQALISVLELTESNPASRKKEKHDLFEVTEGEALEVVLLNAEDATIGRLFIGKSGPDFFSTYVRKASSNHVYLAEDLRKHVFTRPPGSWRDTTIFSFDPQEATEILITSNEQPIRISKDTQNNWHLEKPISALADTEAVEQWLKLFASLQASGYADGVTVEESGVTAPEISIRVAMEDGLDKEVLVGKNEKDESLYYAKKAGAEYLYTLHQSIVEGLTPDVRHFEKAPEQPEAH